MPFIACTIHCLLSVHFFCWFEAIWIVTWRFQCFLLKNYHFLISHLWAGKRWRRSKAFVKHNYMAFACHIVYLLQYFSLNWKEYEQRFKSSHISNEAKFSNHIHSLYSVDKNVSLESVEKMHKTKYTRGDKMNNKGKTCWWKTCFYICWYQSVLASG